MIGLKLLLLWGKFLIAAVITVIIEHGVITSPPWFGTTAILTACGFGVITRLIWREYRAQQTGAGPHQIVHYTRD